MESKRIKCKEERFNLKITGTSNEGNSLESIHFPSSETSSKRAYYSEHLTQLDKQIDYRAPETVTGFTWQVKTEKHAPTVKTLTHPHFRRVIASETKWISLENNHQIVFPVVAFQPKVQLDYEVEPDKLCRKVEVERKRRKYQSLDINCILGDLKVEKRRLIPPTECECIPNEELYGINYLANFSPLEYYDDEEFDCRVPDEWMSLGLIDGIRHPVPGIAFVPVARSSSSSSAVNPISGKVLCGYQWQFCAVINYDLEVNKYNVIILKDFREYLLPRIYILFLAEDPEIFGARVKNALDRRNECENQMRYQLYLDSMDVSGFGEIDDVSLKRIIKSTTRFRSTRVHENIFESVRMKLFSLEL
ncbi:dynein axonemal heavy chain 1-like isoform X2 [Ischnura elegans]|uniref:dynein axonemal heavy chain 1-like isoform X2 n=1 Tax=Ischnura elegans TaxID=197161 RepID=UPI001ED86F94|nr:dynein axonemal heavy chain 1-like isoform X2 [Ischnura elegans]